MRRVLLVLGCIGLAAPTFAGGSPSPDRLQVGELSSIALESPHPYPGRLAGADSVLIRELHHPGATYMVVSFSQFDLAPGDELIVRDPRGASHHRYQGRGLRDLGTFWSKSVPGDTLVIELHSRDSGAFGYAIDQYEYGIVPMHPKSICNADDKQSAKCYETSHPNYYDTALSVGRLRFCGGLCTGSLVSCQDHFLTNEHCKGACGVTNAEVFMDYERPSCGGPTPSGYPTYQGLVDVDTDATLDYWLFQLDGNPADVHGYITLEPRALVLDEEIYIAQHPGGRLKELAIESDSNTGGVCRIDDAMRNGNGANTDTGYMCDTESGSSGSPVLSATSHRMVALHHFGGCLNAGVRMFLIGPDIDPFLPASSFGLVLAAPVGVGATASLPGELTVSWTALAGASSYVIQRSTTGCGGPFARVGTSAASPYVDRGLSGGVAYSYIVQGVDADGCAGAASACVTRVATGACNLLPSFAGLATAASGLSDVCSVDLAWAQVTGACSTDVVYNIYRDVVPGITPGPANLIAACVAAAGYADTSVSPGVRYYYVVRAEDRGGAGSGVCAGGAEESNRLARSARATSGTPFGQLYDGAEAGATLLLADSPWVTSTADSRLGARSYQIPGDPINLCASLTTPPFIPTAASVLSYSTRLQSIEIDSPGVAWDGGDVEISADAGASWSILNPTPSYPTSFISTSTACTNRGSSPAYSGDSGGAWIDATAPLGAYRGQEIQVRFRFATDGAAVSGAWWIDEVRVSDVSDAACGAVPVPPGEVSPLGSTYRLTLVKRSGGRIEAAYEARPAAESVVGYNFYQGDIGSFYNHGAVPFLCDPPFTTLAPDHLAITFTPGPANHYYDVTAWNGDSVDGQEGTIGLGRPAVESTCPPSNNF